MNKITRAAMVAASTLSILAVAGTANAAILASENFDTGVGDWAGYGNTPVATVANDTGTLRVTGTGNWSGALSYFGGIASSTGPERKTPLGDGYIAQLRVYLDPDAVPAGEGFDLTVAASNVADGTHLRDFIFHVAKDTSTEALLVAGSNNTNGNVREDLESLNHATVAVAGWYTLQHSFYANATGALAVDLNLLDANGEVLWKETRTNAADTIDIVGGARYQWLTVVDGSFKFDNQSLERVEVKAVDKCGDDVWKVSGLFKNQGQCIASLNANANAGK